MADSSCDYKRGGGVQLQEKPSVCELLSTTSTVIVTSKQSSNTRSEQQPCATTVPPTIRSLLKGKNQYGEICICDMSVDTPLFVFVSNVLLATADLDASLNSKQW